MKTCHLILKHKWFDLIQQGKKLVEYRRNTPYYRKRIRGADRVVFHRGYTSQTMTFAIQDKAAVGSTIEIHLGARLGKFEGEIDVLFEQFKNPLGLLADDIGVFSKINLKKWFLALLQKAFREYPEIAEREIPKDCEEALKFMEQKNIERKNWLDIWVADLTKNQSVV